MKPLSKVGEQAVFEMGGPTWGQRAIHAAINEKLRMSGSVTSLVLSKHYKHL